MNIAKVAQEIADRISGRLPEVQCHVSPIRSVTEPAFVMPLPDRIDFDATYQRGADRITYPALMLVSTVADDTTLDRIGQYCDGAGPKSVKQIVESGDYGEFDVIRVVSITFDIVTWGSCDYQSALFEFEIMGQGGVAA